MIRHKIGFLLVLLALIQFFFLPFMGALFGPNYAKYLSVTIVYCVIATIIWLEVEDLREFHLEDISLWLIVFSCFLRSRLGIENEIFYRLLLAVFGLSIVIFVIINRSKIPKANRELVKTGILVGLITVAVITFFESFQPQHWLSSMYSGNVVLSIIRDSFYQISFATVIEEVLLRGLLIGYLIKFGVKENTAFWVQAFVFWLLHYYHLGNPITFFISIPLLTLSTSLLVRRYKQLFPAIIVHTLVNGLTQNLLNIIF